MMGADSYQQAQQAQALVADGRVRHLWDNYLALGHGYRKVLPLAPDCKVAWDIYLLYRPSVKRFRYALESDGKKGWTPPPPDFWMHQLSCMTKEQYFDSKILRENIEKILGENQSAQNSNARPAALAATF